ALGAEPDTASAPGAEPEEIDLGVDFSDLEAFDAPAGTGEQAAERPAAQELADLDFDFEAGAGAGAEVQSAEEPPAEPAFELEFGEGSEQTPAPQVSGEEEAEAAPGSEWELESLL